MAPIEQGENLEDIAGLTLNALQEDFELTTAVELSISCSIESPHDCMIVFYSDEENLQEIGRTEIQKCTSTPDFITTFAITYSFEKQRKFRFDLYGMKHSNIKSLLRQEPLGSAKFNVHEIVCAPDRRLEKPLSKGGSITVFFEELSRLNHLLKLRLSIECKKCSGIYSIRLARTTKDRVIPMYVTEGIEGLPCSMF